MHGRRVDRNKIAALPSVIPGLGHLYKHHYIVGIELMIGGNALMIFVARWLSLAPVGLSLVIIPALWFASVAASAYDATDEHGAHPWLHVWRLTRGKLSSVNHKARGFVPWCHLLRPLWLEQAHGSKRDRQIPFLLGNGQAA